MRDRYFMKTSSLSSRKSFMLACNQPTVKCVASVMAIAMANKKEKALGPSSCWWELHSECLSVKIVFLWSSECAQSCDGPASFHLWSFRKKLSCSTSVCTNRIYDNSASSPLIPIHIITPLDECELHSCDTLCTWTFCRGSVHALRLCVHYASYAFHFFLISPARSESAFDSPHQIFAERTQTEELGTNFPCYLAIPFPNRSLLFTRTCSSVLLSQRAFTLITDFFKCSADGWLLEIPLSCSQLLTKLFCSRVAGKNCEPWEWERSTGGRVIYPPTPTHHQQFTVCVTFRLVKRKARRESCVSLVRGVEEVWRNFQPLLPQIHFSNGKHDECGVGKALAASVCCFSLWRSEVLVFKQTTKTRVPPLKWS